MRQSLHGPDERFDYHLKYELWMLAETFSRLKNLDPGAPSIEPVLANALIESFCIHARSLIEFFYKSDTSDKRARGYTNSNYVPFVGEDSRQQIWDRLNQQIAHLDKQARSIDPVGRINTNELRDINNLLAREIQRFKVCLRRPDYDPSTVYDLPLSSERISQPTTTHVPGQIYTVGGKNP